MASIKVSAFGAYLISWTVNEREVLYQGSEIKRTGIPLLFPNFDTGVPLPKHGFGRISQWQSIEETTEKCHLSLTENDILPEFRQIYPYKFVANLKIKASDNQLDYLLEVKNSSQKDLPLSPALHPYWPIKHDEKSKIKLINFSQFNPKNINWEDNPPDDTYTLNGEFIADFPDYRLIIKEVKENNQSSFKKLQIWSQNSTFPDYNFLCLEPSTRPKNGINTDPILVPPNNTVKFHLIFEVIFP
jgi:D-hexose-6-phosphate mutarotase